MKFYGGVRGGKIKEQVIRCWLESDIHQVYKEILLNFWKPVADRMQPSCMETCSGEYSRIAFKSLSTHLQRL